MKCALCDKVALHIVGRKGYCKNHDSAAKAEALRVNSEQHAKYETSPYLLHKRTAKCWRELEW